MSFINRFFRIAFSELLSELKSLPIWQHLLMLTFVDMLQAILSVILYLSVSNTLVLNLHIICFTGIRKSYFYYQWHLFCISEYLNIVSPPFLTSYSVYVSMFCLYSHDIIFSLYYHWHHICGCTCFMYKFYIHFYILLKLNPVLYLSCVLDMS